MFKLKHPTQTGNYIVRTYGEIVYVKDGVAETESERTKRALVLQGFRELSGEEKTQKKEARKVKKTSKRKRKK